MPRAADIIARLRDSLADPLSKRWTDERLYSLIDDAQYILATEALLIRKKAVVLVTSGTPVQAYPSDLYKLYRVTDSANVKIPMHSFDYMDGIDSTWETEYADLISFIVHDNSSINSYRVYPIITSPVIGTVINTVQSLSSVYGIIATLLNATIVPNVFGVAAGDSIEDDIYGLVTELVLPTGVSADTGVSYTEIIMHYLAMPTTVTSLTPDLSIAEDYDNAMYHFALAMANLDYADTQNLAMFREELSLFNEILKQAVIESNSNFATQMPRATVPLWAE